MPEPSIPSSRSRHLFATAQGSRQGAFGPADWALLAGVALIWGSSYMLIDISLESLKPSAIAWLRSLLGFLILTAFPIARRRIDRSDWAGMALLSLTWVAVPFMLFPLAQRHIDSALAGMLNALVPIWSTTITALLLRTPPRLRLAIGISTGFLGAALIGLPAARGSEAGAFGVALVVAATMLYGFSLNTAVPLQQRYGAPAVMMWALGVSTVLLAPLGLTAAALSSVSLPSAVAVSILGILNTGGGYVIMAALVGRVGSTRGSIAVYFLPVVATILGVVFRNETVLPSQLAGIGMILSGAWLSSRSER